MDHTTEQWTTRGRDRSGRSATNHSRVTRETPPRQRAALLVLAAVAALVVLGGAVDALAMAGRVHPGVSVGGVARHRHVALQELDREACGRGCVFRLRHPYG